jgi:hypothetical protein
MLYTARVVSGEAQTGRTSISTIKHVPLKIEVFPHRRGIRVRLSLLTEEETSWTFDLLAPDLPTVCAEVGIDENELVWQASEEKTA